MVLGMRCYFLCVEKAVSSLTFGTFSCLLQCLERHGIVLKSDDGNRLCREIPSVLIYLATMDVTGQEYHAITL